MALLVALQFWSSLFGGIVTLCAIGAWAVWVLAVQPRAAPPVLAQAGLGVAAGLVLVLPLAVPYSEARRGHPEYSHPVEEAFAASATPRTYLSPAATGGTPAASSYHWLRRHYSATRRSYAPTGDWRLANWT